MSSTSPTRYVFTSRHRDRTRKTNPTSPEFFWGSSFKPLHLTHQPWVSTYLRSGQNGYERPRLPFAVQYAHLHGGGDHSTPKSNPPSLPPTSFVARNAKAEIILDIVDPNNSSNSSEPERSSNSSGSIVDDSAGSPELDYFSLPHRCSEIIRQDIWDVEATSPAHPVHCQVCESVRSESSAGFEAPLNAKGSCHEAPDPKMKRQDSTLPITAFQDVLLGVITTEDVYGSSPTHPDSDL